MNGSGEETTDTRIRHLFTQLSQLPDSAPERAAIRDELVTEHTSLARHLALRFTHRGEPVDDLIQVAMVGLIHAVDRFDPERGIEFPSYAVPTIVGEIKRHFRDHAWSMRVPRRLKELHLAISAATSEWTHRNGRAPNASQLAEHLKIPREEVLEGLDVAGAYRSVSLDEPLKGSDEATISLATSLGENDPELAQVEIRHVLAPLLEQLDERERRILLLRFFGNMTQSQIAKRIGVSQMHVSRLLSRTLRRMREQLHKPSSST